VAGAAISDEAALVRALRAGEEGAYEALVRAHAPHLLAVARRFLRDEHDAQDAVQEAFLAGFKSITSFEEGCRIATWLHRIVVNASLMKLRSRRRRPEQPIDALLPEFAEDGHHLRRPLEWQAPADVLMERQEVRKFVRECVDRLPEAYRTVLLLRDFEELDTSETARLLALEEGTVKTRLHRARQALRGLLEQRLGRSTP
jgi:RNA polymerase sigma-70 factor (ECF subfamily)